MSSKPEPSLFTKAATSGRVGTPVSTSKPPWPPRQMPAKHLRFDTPQKPPRTRKTRDSTSNPRPHSHHPRYRPHPHPRLA